MMRTYPTYPIKHMTETDNRLEKVISRLRENGHRLTPQRLAVIKILVNNREHLTAEQVHARVQADFPMTSLATIYKTITTLKDMGEVLELSFGNQGNRYDGNDPQPHPHLICVKCKRIIDPEIPALEELSQDLVRMTGYQVLSHRLDFFGICPQCQQEESTRESIISK